MKAQLGIITPEIKARLTANKIEIMQALSAVSKPRPETLVYQVVVRTAGEPKGMTVIDPSGDGLEAFTRSCHGRFGKARVVSIESKQRYGGED